MFFSSRGVLIFYIFLQNISQVRLQDVPQFLLNTHKGEEVLQNEKKLPFWNSSINKEPGQENQHLRDTCIVRCS